jgi:hypothetical protein
VDESSGKPLAEPEPITSPAPSAAFLSISADGRRLAYSSILETQAIQRLPFDPVAGGAAGPPSAVTTGTRFWANPDPSPDGQNVVAYSQGNPEGHLYIFRADGSSTSRQLTSDTAIDRVPRRSPDGSWITAFSTRNSNSLRGGIPPGRRGAEDYAWASVASFQYSIVTPLTRPSHSCLSAA